MKKARMLSMIGLVLVLLIAAVPAVYADPIPGEGNTDVTVVNTNQNQSASPASVTAFYYNPSGVSELSRLANIPSRGSYTFLASDATLGDNWNGSMVVQSDSELAAIASIGYTNGNASDSLTGGAYSGFSAGSTEMYIPFAVRAANVFSRITVQNTEDTPTTIHMAYINRNGGVDFANQIDTLPGLGSKTYDLHVPGGAVPNLANTPYWAANGDWTGGVKITTDGGKKIVAVSTAHWNDYAVAYNGLSTGAAENFIPSAARRYDAVQGWRELTQVIVQCVATSPCNVVIDFVNASTGATDLSLSKNGVPAGASVGANTRAGGDWPASQYQTALGDAWVGSAIARSTNGTNVAVVAFSVRQGQKLAGGYSGANTGNAGQQNFLPVVNQKHVSGTGSCPASNPDANWRQYSLIRIQNPTSNNATNVDIYYFNPDGTLRFQELDKTVQARKSYNRNTRVDCATIVLGNNWTGSMYINSDRPLVAVAENILSAPTGSLMDSYNSYAK